MADDRSGTRGAFLRRDAAELFLRRDDPYGRAQSVHRSDSKAQRGAVAQDFFAGRHDGFFYSGRGAQRIGPLEYPRYFGIARDPLRNLDDVTKQFRGKYSWAASWERKTSFYCSKD